LQETHEQVEDLRLERDRRVTSFKLAALGIKLMVAEKIPHGGAPRDLPARLPRKSRESPG
jgi:hypothetical protein